jgi:hypothetical protein
MRAPSKMFPVQGPPFGKWQAWLISGASGHAAFCDGRGLGQDLPARPALGERVSPFRGGRGRRLHGLAAFHHQLGLWRATCLSGA